MKTAMRCHVTPITMTIIKEKIQQVSMKMGRKWNTYTLLVAPKFNTSLIKNNMEVLQRAKGRSTI
jgi:hypothetical protein